MSDKHAKDSLGTRIKTYESVSKSFLMKRTPVIIRIDGKAFHTFTKRFERPFSELMHQLMSYTTEKLVANIQNAKIAYTQSDEISILLNDWKSLHTDQWFDGNIQKIASISASLATGFFNAAYHKHVYENTYSDMNLTNETAFFDARVFNVPKEDVVNYFIWRQQDASRNSVQMLAQAYFSHNQLQGKNNSQLQDMLMLEKGVNWNDTDAWKRRGSCVYRNVDGIVADNNIPLFAADREYIEDHLKADS